MLPHSDHTRLLQTRVPISQDYHFTVPCLPQFLQSKTLTTSVTVTITLSVLAHGLRYTVRITTSIHSLRLLSHAFNADQPLNIPEYQHPFHTSLSYQSASNPLGISHLQLIHTSFLHGPSSTDLHSQTFLHGPDLVARKTSFSIPSQLASIRFLSSLRIRPSPYSRCRLAPRNGSALHHRPTVTARAWHTTAVRCPAMALISLEARQTQHHRIGRNGSRSSFASKACPEISRLLIFTNSSRNMATSRISRLKMLGLERSF